MVHMHAATMVNLIQTTSTFFLALCTITAKLSSASNYCIKSECNETASEMLKEINLLANPCDNFYDFACGEMVKRPIPADRGSIGTITDLNKLVIAQIIQSIKTNGTKPPDLAKRLVRKFHSVCVSSDHAKHRNTNSLLNDLDVIGGFPLLNPNWNESNFDLEEVLGKLSNVIGFGRDSLIKVTVSTDQADTSKYVIQIEQPGIALGRKSQLRYVNAYKQYINSTLTFLRPCGNTSAQEIDDIFKFETSLSNISLTRTELNDYLKYYKKLNISDLQKSGNGINWLKLLTNLFGTGKVNNSEEVVILMGTKFVRELNRLITSTSKRTLANYICWKIIYAAYPSLNSTFHEILQVFVKSYSGESNPLPIDELCRYNIVGRMGAALAATYVRDNFHQESLTVLESIGDDIIKEVAKSINSATWMDIVTKQNAIKKLNLTRVILGYPCEVTDDAILRTYLSPIQLTDDFHKNKQLLTIIDVKTNFNLLRKTVDKFHWTIFVDKLYDIVPTVYFKKNLILLPAGFLQEMIFNRAKPLFRNYARLGFFFGHEFSHGFDSIGKAFNFQGNLEDWWTNTTNINFRLRKNCMADQYSRYVFMNLTIKGEQTVAEDISDNGAIRAAYNAYLSKVNQDRNLYQLRQYNQKQLFWISYAQVFCTKYRLKFAKSMTSWTSYSFAKNRVNGPLSNMAEFAADFNCSSSTKMNPANKCIVL